jgi:hypothetical protein
MTTDSELLVLVDASDDANEALYELVEELDDGPKKGSGLQLQHFNITARSTLRVIDFKKKKGKAGGNESYVRAEAETLDQALEVVI